MAKQLISNFSKGELGPQLYGRVDIPQYAAGAKQVRNFIIQRYGGLAFRPGFRLVGEADSLTDETLFVPFQYNIEQAYVIAHGDYDMRLLANGGFVLEENLEIISATQAAQAVLEVNYHDYAVGERFYISGVVGMTQLNGMFVTVVGVVDANHIRINVNSTDFSTFVSSDGTDRVGAPPPPPPPPPPPSPPPPPPPPADTGGGGGSGSGLGGGLNGGGLVSYD